MGETSPVLLLAGVVFLLLLFVGIFAATIIYLGKSRPDGKKESRSGRDRPGPEADPAAPIPEAVAPEPEQAVEAPARPGEVMRVIRDEQTGRVVVEVEGRQYAHIREIADARVGRRVLWAIADLVRFTGGMATNPQAVRSVQETQAQAFAASDTVRPSGAAAPPAAAPTAPPPSRPFSVPGPAVADAQQPRQRYSMVDFFRRGFDRSAPAELQPSPTSFIDEIEAILQGYIRGLPSPLPDEVHVLTGEDGMLRIEVGLYAYSSPDEVPNPQIRQLIKAAVAEWEKQ